MKRVAGAAVAVEEASLSFLVSRGLSIREIALRLESSDSNVRYWLAKYGLRTQRGREIAERLPNRRSGICAECCAEFGRKKISGRDRLKFCGVSCAATYNNRRRRIGRDNPDTALYGCRSCGKERGSSSRNSPLCRDCAKSERRQKISDTTLVDMRQKYSTPQFHAKIRGHSREVYDGPMLCQACGYLLHVDVCHIRPVADFPETASLAEVNARDNLVALCPTHHWEFDNGHLSLAA